MWQQILSFRPPMPDGRLAQESANRSLRFFANLHATRSCSRTFGESAVVPRSYEVAINDQKTNVVANLITITKESQLDPKQQKRLIKILESTQAIPLNQRCSQLGIAIGTISGLIAALSFIGCIRMLLIKEQEAKAKGEKNSPLTPEEQKIFELLMGGLCLLAIISQLVFQFLRVTESPTICRLPSRMPHAQQMQLKFIALAEAITEIESLDLEVQIAPKAKP